MARQIVVKGTGAAASSGQPPAIKQPGSTPDFVRSEVALFARARRRGRDLMAGTDAVHDAGEFYLPKWGNEDDDTYRIRSTLTEVYGAFPRCVSAARGLVGAKPPQLADDTPEQITEHWKDLDGEGTHGEVFVMREFEEGLVDGPAFILVDFPALAAPVATLEDFQKNGLRPYWHQVSCDQIVNWRTEKINGKTALTMVTICEEAEENVGEFGVACVTQYRTIRLEIVPEKKGSRKKRNAITWTIWRKRSDKQGEVWYVYDEGEYKGPKRIPLATGYLGRKVAPLVAEPPLTALAELNVGHYRVSSDRRYMMSIVHAPTFVLEGWTDPAPSSTTPPGANAITAPSEINLGPNTTLKTPPGCKAVWVQAESNGLSSSKEEKDDLVAQMGSMSIAFLQQERKAQETAAAHRINSIAQNATLATAARGLQDLIDDALELHAQYLGLDVAPTCTVNTVYDEDALDAQTIAALGQLAADNQMTIKTLLTILQRGNVIPDDIDLDDEEAMLDQKQRDAQDAAVNAAARARAMITAGLAGGRAAARGTKGKGGKKVKKPGAPPTGDLTDPADPAHPLAA